MSEKVNHSTNNTNNNTNLAFSSKFFLRKNDLMTKSSSSTTSASTTITIPTCEKISFSKWLGSKGKSTTGTERNVERDKMQLLSPKAVCLSYYDSYILYLIIKSFYLIVNLEKNQLIMII